MRLANLNFGTSSDIRLEQTECLKSIFFIMSGSSFQVSSLRKTSQHRNLVCVYNKVCSKIKKGDIEGGIIDLKKHLKQI